MPIPKPKKGEKEQEFISRCMGDKIMNKDYPDQEQRAGVCYSQWRTKEVNTTIQFNYQVPITESKNEDNKDFVIEGTAINATTTSNNHKFIDEELQSSAHTLSDVPLLKDHRNEVDYIMGRVIKSGYGDKKVTFRAKVIDKNAQEMIKDGRLNSVSVGAMVESFDIDEDDDSYVAKGITFKELSLVAVGADEGATFGVALSEACKLTTDIKKKEEMSMTDKTTTTEAPETVTKEELADTVAKAVKEALEVKEAEIKAKEAEDVKVKEAAKKKEAEEKATKKAEEKATKEAEEKKIADEKAAKIAKEANEKDSKYTFSESTGSLSGGAMTMERVI